MRVNALNNYNGYNFSVEMMINGTLQNRYGVSRVIRHNLGHKARNHKFIKLIFLFKLVNCFFLLLNLVLIFEFGPERALQTTASSSPKSEQISFLSLYAF
jgi:hypothetical protein